MRKVIATAAIVTSLGISGCAVVALPALGVYMLLEKDEKKPVAGYNSFSLKVRDGEKIFGYDINNDGTIDEAFYARTNQAIETLEHPEGKRWMEFTKDSIQKDDLEHLVSDGLPPEKQLWNYPKNTRIMTSPEQAYLNTQYERAQNK